MADLIFDDSDFKQGVDRLIGNVEKTQMVALQRVAEELLRLSQLEVPLDVSFLMQSANSEPDGQEYLVSYNTPYAARLHEHPEFNFKNGRKGKYLENPMKMNQHAFRQFFDEEMGAVYA